ncbi:MAG: hypothetical protein CMM87_04710 [Rickettsiales bacterium]|nr:hypothetical protein [Rickettsiales bacterium]|tara:strand:+ start:4158 stop:5666 length:1509 start_codon:yes stop_codon:yes gene_type:complete
MLKKIFINLFILGFVCIEASAEETKPTATAGHDKKPEILSESLQSAYKNSVTIPLADTQREIARDALIQAKAARWPTINLVASGSGAISDTKSVQRTTVNNVSRRLPTKNRVPQSSASTNLELTQTLYSGGAIDGNIEIATLTEILQNNNFLEAENSFVLEVITSLLNVLEARGLLKVAIRKKELLEKRADDMQIRADYGLESITSLESTKAEAEQAKAELEAQKTDLQVAEKTYEILTGKTLDQSDIDIPSPSIPDSFNLVQETALANSYETKAKMLGVEIAEQQANVSESAIYPQLSLTATGGRNWSSSNGATTPDKVNWSRQDNATVALKLTVPFDYTGSKHADVRSKRTAHAQKRLDEMNFRRQFVLKLFQVWKTYKTSLSNQNKYLAQVKAADLSLEAVQEQYNAGTMRYLDVLEAISRAAQANNLYIRNKKAALLNGYELLKRMGTLTKTLEKSIASEQLPQVKESPYWDTTPRQYAPFGWKSDPVLANIKFEKQG